MYVFLTVPAWQIFAGLFGVVVAGSVIASLFAYAYDRWVNPERHQLLDIRRNLETVRKERKPIFRKEGKDLSPLFPAHVQNYCANCTDEEFDTLLKKVYSQFGRKYRKDVHLF